MSVILRSPHIVPSLFAQGLDGDAPAMQAPPLSGRLAAKVVRLRRALLPDIEGRLARYAAALICSAATFQGIGRPLVRAASLAVRMPFVD